MLPTLAHPLATIEAQNENLRRLARSMRVCLFDVYAYYMVETEIVFENGYRTTRMRRRMDPQNWIGTLHPSPAGLDLWHEALVDFLDRAASGSIQYCAGLARNQDPNRCYRFALPSDPTGNAAQHVCPYARTGMLGH